MNNEGITSEELRLLLSNDLIEDTDIFKMDSMYRPRAKRHRKMKRWFHRLLPFFMFR